MANKSMAQEKADRRAATNRDLDKRRKQAEQAVESTSGYLAGSLSKIKKAQKKRKSLLDNL
jgi:hypothetical protein